MRVKLATLIIGYTVMNLAFSCCNNVKYIDYRSIGIKLPAAQIDATDSLIFSITMVDVRYLASIGPGLLSSAVASQCEEGWGGQRYSVSEFQVISDADFDDAHPAGTPLNDIVMVAEYINYQTQGARPIEEIDLNAHFNAWNDMWITQRPTRSKTHRLTVSFQKGDGTTMTAVSEAIVWV